MEMNWEASAGLSVEDITPERPAFLGGYIARDTPSSGISDRLFIRVGVFRDGKGKTLALVGVDLLEMPEGISEEFYREAKVRFGFRREEIVLNFIHTHCAPILKGHFAKPEWKVDEEYVSRFKEKLLRAAENAIADLSPAKFRFGMTKIRFGVNRRMKTAAGIEMRPNPEGFVINDVPVLSVERPGKPDGIFYSMSCHPTSRGGTLVSADFPGFVAKHFGGNLAFLQGAAGSTKPGVLTPDGTGFIAASPEWLENAGKTIAGQLKSFLFSDGMREFVPDFGASLVKVNLKLDENRIPSEELFEKAAEENPGYPCYRHIADHFQKELRDRSYAAECPVEVGFARLSDRIGFLTVSGEITAEAAENMLDAIRKPGGTVFLLGYCGYLAAYLPTDAMLPEGGYEALDSQYYYGMPLPFAPGIDRSLSDTARKAFELAGNAENAKTGTGRT